ncbi:ethanolamine kinase 1-like [Clytia hemisphaerica]
MLTESEHTRINGIPHYEVTVKDDCLDDLSKQLLNQIKNGWKIEGKLNYSEGTTNDLYGFRIKKDQQNEIVLFRIYGAKTELMIDRELELVSFMLLSKNGLATNLYCTFENGFCYQYQQGRTLTPIDLTEELFLKKTAELVARLHSLDYSNVSGKKLFESNRGDAFSDIDRYMNLLKINGNDDVNSVSTDNCFHLFPNSPSLTGINLQAIEAEIKELKEKVAAFEEQPERTYCHNDINCPNLIYDGDKGTFHIIDYEYSGVNYAAYDIANFFDEFPGNTNIDFSLFPSEETQRKWIKYYWMERLKINGKEWMEDDCASKTMNDLFLHVQIFTLVSHILWGVWALVQARHLSNPTEMNGYAEIRLVEYFKQKTTVMDGIREKTIE